MIHDWQMTETDSEVVFTRPSTGAVYTFERTKDGWQATILRSRKDEPIAESWTDTQFAEFKAALTK